MSQAPSTTTTLAAFPAPALSSVTLKVKPRPDSKARTDEKMAARHFRLLGPGIHSAQRKSWSDVREQSSCRVPTLNVIPICQQPAENLYTRTMADGTEVVQFRSNFEAEQDAVQRAKSIRAEVKAKVKTSAKHRILQSIGRAARPKPRFVVDRVARNGTLELREFKLAQQ